MMSLATIKAVNREHAQEAARNGRTPFVYFSVVEVDQTDGFPFPFFGDYRPDGWEMVDTHFVDATGWGTEDEPALTVEQFRRVIRDSIGDHAANRETVGWAVIEAGQFQVRVGEFTRPAPRPANPYDDGKAV